MKLFSGHLALLICFVFFMPAKALKIEFHDFKTAAQEQLYLQLIAELRCVKCQNQNLASSNADLAKDMRNKAYELILKGGSRDDVVKYMTDRYGDFVLYKPPFKKNTLLLWIGPPLFLLISLFLLFRLIRNQKKDAAETLSDDQREKMQALLKNK